MWKWLFVFIDVWLLSATAICGGPHAGHQDTSNVTFDFNDIEIRSFIKIVSELTGENYVIDPAVNGKITITSPSPIPRDALESVFQETLNVYGYSAVREGNIVKIIPASRARQEGSGVSRARGSGESIETRILHLNTIDAGELKSLVQPLLTRAGHFAAHPASNTAILTDLSRNVRRISEIITLLDKAGPKSRLRVYPLTHASAEDIAEVLTRLFVNLPGAHQLRPVFVADTRSNILLVNASESIQGQLPDILTALDTPVEKTRAAIRVFPLKNAEAKDIAAILNAQLMQPETEGKGTPSGGASRWMVSAAPATNSLIVTASPEMFSTIEQVIESLDTPRKQVLVEGLIVEISADKTQELGLEWRLTNEIADDGYRAVGGTNLPAGNGSNLQRAMVDPYHFPTGMVLGLVKGTISFGGMEFANIAALARAMQASGDVNILSTPHITTLDNMEAEIIVGEERPFLKSSQTTDTGSTVRTYEFKDIGLTMRITPRITDDGEVILNLFQEIKNFVAESDIGAVTSTKREARTTIRVADGQMAVIGGLLKEDTLRQTNTVPCLGRIPLVSYLFSSTRNSHRKTNLLIFITPHILPDQQSLRNITETFRKTAGEPDGGAKK